MKIPSEVHNIIKGGKSRVGCKKNYIYPKHFCISNKVIGLYKIKGSIWVNWC